MRLLPQDIAATVVAVVLTVGVTILGFYEKPIPGEMGSGLGAAITWLFVRSAQQAERERTNGH